MGGEHSKLLAGKPTVLVIGGGGGGVTAAKELDKSGLFNVVLIDRKDYYFHNIGALRATVEPAFAENLITPYDRALVNGIVVQAEVLSINHDSVTVHGREQPIKFDYCVLAMGTSYAFPAKVADPSAKSVVPIYQKIAQSVRSSRNICIIGGGPVGVELAGEIKTDFPDKNVTLVHSHKELMNKGGLNPKMAVKAEKKLTKLGVNLVLGQKVLLEELPQANGMCYIEGHHLIKTTNGGSFQSDLIFFANGAQPNFESLKANFATRLDAENRIKVDKFLRVVECSNIYAVGDINNVPELKMFVTAQKQAVVCAQNIINSHNGKDQKEYPVDAAIMLATIGRKGGVGVLFGRVVGDTITSSIKGKDLFYKKTRGMLNYSKGEASEEDHDIKLQNLAAALQISKAAAKELANRGLGNVERPPNADHT